MRHHVCSSRPLGLHGFGNGVPKGFFTTPIHVKFRKVGEIARCLPHKKNKISPRYVALASARIAPKICHLPGPAANNDLLVPQISSKSVYFWRSCSLYVNIVKTRHKANPILGEAITSRRVKTQRFLAAPAAGETKPYQTWRGDRHRGPRLQHVLLPLKLLGSDA